MIASLLPMAESALWRAPLADAPLVNFPQGICGVFTPGVLARVDDPSQRDPVLFTTAEAATAAWRLRSYQEKMLEGLREDLRSGTSPWLALSSPMQTGKSLMTGPIIRMLRQELGDVRVLILTSSRVITQQIEEDLLGGFPADEVGRFDALVKQPRPVTVASTLSLARNLDRFPPGPKTVLILDEAYSTQSPSVRRILRHFGLAERSTEGDRRRIVPASGNGLVIGFSGTGAGLDGYKISGRLSLLEAMEAGWVRHMRGERLPVRIEGQRMLATGGERMIWWKATPKNAEFLARLFEEKIRPEARKSLVFVPTIRHGRLLQKALERMYGQGFVRFVHSGVNPDLVSAQLQAWRDRGGALISIRMLSRGFRATGAEAIFHTYQTDSLELFGQRTGRAWGVAEGISLPDLYVLEATWGAGGEFANLPRLAGLVDYPKDVFETRSLKGSSPTIEKKTEQRRRRAEAIRQGKVSPLFARVPMSQDWQRIFSEILEKAGGGASLVKRTGLKPETVAAFELGVIPTRLVQVERLEDFLGGSESSRDLWVRLWKAAVKEIQAGYEEVDEAAKQDLLKWRGAIDSPFLEGGLDHSLEELLSGFFTNGLGREPWLQGFLKRLQKSSLTAHLSEEELLPIVQETLNSYLPTLSERDRDIFQKASLEEPPSLRTVLARKYEVSENLIPVVIERITDGLHRSINRRLLQGIVATMSEEGKATTHPIFWVTIDHLDLSARLRAKLQIGGIKYLGELVQKTEPEIMEIVWNRKYLDELKTALEDLGLRLGMTITWPSQQ
jgi:superfamily II DNA or RNA helicase